MIRQSILKKSTSSLTNRDVLGDEARLAETAGSIYAGGTSTNTPAPATNSLYHHPTAPSAKIVRFSGVDSIEKISSNFDEGSTPFLLPSTPTSVYPVNLKSFSLATSTFYKNKFKTFKPTLPDTLLKKPTLSSLSISPKGNNNTSNNDSNNAPLSPTTAGNVSSSNSNSTMNSSSSKNNQAIRNFYKNSKIVVPFKQISLFSSEDESQQVENEYKQQVTKPIIKQKTGSSTQSAISALMRQQTYLTSVDQINGNLITNTTNNNNNNNSNNKYDPSSQQRSSSTTLRRISSKQKRFILTINYKN